MHENVDNKQLRSFGFLVGGVFALLGLWPLLLGKDMRLRAVIPAALSRSACAGELETHLSGVDENRSPSRLDQHPD
jgi:hypothetical protein